MYTLIFKFKGRNGCVYDVYYTNEQGQQRIIGNIYCYFNFGEPGHLCQVKREVEYDGMNKDMLDFHTVGSFKEYEISEEIKNKLYNRAKTIFAETRYWM